MYLIFDTETTGLPAHQNAPLSESHNWPRVVQIAWQVHSPKGALVSQNNFLIKPVGFDIPYNATKTHGITTERALLEGEDLRRIMLLFKNDLENSQVLIGHNIEFDIKIVGAEFFRLDIENIFSKIKWFDTQKDSTEFCKLPGGRAGKYKWPTLSELHTKLFGVSFENMHDATFDVHATARCFFDL